MQKVLVAYIVVQLVCAIVAALAVTSVVKGTSKPKNPSKCPGDNYQEASGSSCDALKVLPQYDIDGQGTPVQMCKASCASNVTWAWGCTSNTSIGPIKTGEYAAVECSSLKGKPVTYWIVAGVVLVLPMVFFFPFIFKKHKKATQSNGK